MIEREQMDEQRRMADAFEAMLKDGLDGIILQVLYDVEENNLPIPSLYLSEVRSDWKEGDDTEAARTIDYFCKELGIDPVKWAAALIEDGQGNDHGYRTAIRREALRLQRVGKTIGKFLTESSYDALPIEVGDGSGGGSAEIMLALGAEHVLELRGDGEYWTEEAIDDDDSAIGFSIRYIAQIALRSPQA